MALSDEELQFYRDCAERGMTTRDVSNAVVGAGFPPRTLSAIYNSSIRHNIHFRPARGGSRPPSQVDADNAAKSILVFWHVSRKEFVPQVLADVARLAGITKGQASRAIGILLRGRLAVRSFLEIGNGSRIAVYDISAAGREVVAKTLKKTKFETRAEKACSSLLVRRATTPGDSAIRRRGAFQENGDAHADR
jgi:hypothetical protein